MALSYPRSKIKDALSNANPVWFTLYASFAAFCLYTSIYAFRKSFTAATFDGLEYAGHSYKSWLIISQVLGYGAAKFFGIKYIAELNPNKRTSGILLMVGIAALSWLLFALVPAPYNIVFLFMNGFPLGLVWGMVFGFLEGRRMTEVLGASLSVSFIFSAGLCRSVGSYLMRDWGVSQTWMPFAACGVFFIPLLVFLFLLDKLPPPSPLDEELRTKRRPMNGEQRKQFVNTFLPGIIFFVLGYMLLTAFRDIRENFASDVWKILGYGNQPGIYTQTETPVSISVLIIMGSIMLIKNNKTALMVNHAIIMVGMVLIGISTFLFQQQLISAPLWMILIGLGLYLGYVPFNSIFFDRLIAAFQYVGTVGFIMYVADAFGYLGSIGVLLFKESGVTQQNWLQFFVTSGYYISFVGTALIGGSMIYFHFKHKDIVQLANS
jgi:hypothetical protein